MSSAAKRPVDFFPTLSAEPRLGPQHLSREGSYSVDWIEQIFDYARVYMR